MARRQIRVVGAHTDRERTTAGGAAVAVAAGIVVDAHVLRSEHPVLVAERNVGGVVDDPLGVTVVARRAAAGNALELARRRASVALDHVTVVAPLAARRRADDPIAA